MLMGCFPKILQQFSNIGCPEYISKCINNPFNTVIKIISGNILK